MNALMKKGIEIQFVQVKSHEEDLFNEMADTICKNELGIPNDRILEKYLSKNLIAVKDEEIKEKLDKLVVKGQENIVIDENNINKSVEKSIKSKETKAVKEENKVKTDENQNEKDEIIQKINDVLSVLEYERLEEVLKYVKRKKNQKK